VGGDVFLYTVIKSGAYDINESCHTGITGIQSGACDKHTVTERGACKIYFYV